LARLWREEPEHEGINVGAPEQSAAAAKPAADEIDQEMMDSVANRLGTSFPKAQATETEETSTEEESATEEKSDPTDTEETSPAEETAAAGKTDETTAEETPAEEETTAEEPAATEPKPGDEYAADTKKLLAKTLAALPETTRKQVEGVIGARIGQIVGKERSERERLGARVEELAAENEQLAAEKGPRFVSADAHPTQLLERESDLAERKGKLDKWLDWAEDNAAGVNLPDSEDYDASKESYTKEQIRAKAREWRRERDEMIPQVRETLRARAQGDAKLKTAFPALFDAKSAEYAKAKNLLKLLPQLKRFANANAIAASFVLGDAALEKLLTANGGAAATEKAKPKTNGELKPRKQAPRAPGGGSQAKGSVVARERDKPASSEAVNQVYRNPTDKRAFRNAVGAAIAGI
jgi:hypothetical protein